MRDVDFYSEIGKLLYAIADVDGVISPTEKKALNELVKTELLPIDGKKDSFGTESAHYAQIEFDFLDEEIEDVYTCLESFIDFVTEHETAINEQMIKVSLKIVKKIADAYYGTNKKERILINKLSDQLTAILNRKETEKLNKSI